MTFSTSSCIRKSAPSFFSDGAAWRKLGAPSSFSPKGNPPTARRFDDGAPTAQMPLLLGESSDGAKSVIQPKHEIDLGFRLCDWCGTLTRGVLVHGHVQCGRCHRVLDECCNGFRAESP
jgi:hypothetical protein